MLPFNLQQVLTEHGQALCWMLGYGASEDEKRKLPSSALLPPRPYLQGHLLGLGPAEWTRTFKG